MRVEFSILLYSDCFSLQAGTYVRFTADIGRMVAHSRVGLQHALTPEVAGCIIIRELCNPYSGEYLSILLRHAPEE